MKYRDPEGSMGNGTNGFEYGKKTHVAQDIDSTAPVELDKTTASLHDSMVAFPMLYAILDRRLQ